MPVENTVVKRSQAMTAANTIARLRLLLNLLWLIRITNLLQGCIVTGLWLILRRSAGPVNTVWDVVATRGYAI
jgi:hypothetical protein